MATITMLTQAAIDSVRIYLKEKIAYARYWAGDVCYRAEINHCEVLPDGRVEITFIISNPVSGSITVTQVELYDRNGVLLASKSESITLQGMEEGIVYRFRISVTAE